MNRRKFLRRSIAGLAIAVAPALVKKVTYGKFPDDLIDFKEKHEFVIDIVTKSRDELIAEGYKVGSDQADFIGSTSEGGYLYSDSLSKAMAEIFQSNYGKPLSLLPKSLS